MRIEPENGIISMMRGDTIILPLKINEGTKLCPEYRRLRSDEKLYFALMEPGQAFEDAVVKKVLTHEDSTDEEGSPLLRLDSRDTEKLLAGRYYYTVKLRTPDSGNDDIVKTLIQPTLFTIYGGTPKIDEESWNDSVIQDGIETVIFDGGDISVRDKSNKS